MISPEYKSGMVLLLILLVMLAVSPVTGAEQAGISGGQLAQVQAAQESGKNIGSLAAPFLSLESKTVEPGTPFDYPVMAWNMDDLANMDLSLLFLEPSSGSGDCSLKCTNVNKGSFVGNALFDSRIGQGACRHDIRISFASSTGLRGSGPVAVISCTLEKPIANAIDTQITIDTASSGTGAALQIPAYGGYIFSGKSPKGDCDGDGYASTRDALMAIQMSVGKQETDLTCDFNGDGKVNSADAREILRFSQTAGLAGQSGLIGGAGSGTGTGQGNTASLPIPLPNPQNIGIGGKGNEQRGVTPITIPRVADKAGGKGFEPIPIP